MEKMKSSSHEAFTVADRSSSHEAFTVADRSSSHEAYTVAKQPRNQHRGGAATKPTPLGSKRLLNHGIGIHLLKCEDPDKMPTINHINPRGKHISFQCESMITVERTLKEMKMDYVKCRVEEGGISVDQLFFHDPDGSMIEICNCEVLPLVPLAGDAIKHVQVSNANFSSCSCRFNKQSKRNNHHKWSNLPSINMKKDFLHFASEVPCTGNPFYTSHSCCMNN
ncbi:hypothetical protein Patl1_05198 [Pistacia atlantica]|uniref:Uncharacterized protein n=1 Tax=Pistacia atlantica TaxID=434234 RepID=A0ACC1BPH8_9ROSI|nr:hypothetical protein Patl1_05198 [Pistacia atlantica]